MIYTYFLLLFKGIINRMIYVIVKRNDILEFFGCLFLLLILYVIGCELNTYCLLGIKSILFDVRSDCIEK